MWKFRQDLTRPPNPPTPPSIPTARFARLDKQNESPNSLNILITRTWNVFVFILKIVFLHVRRGLVGLQWRRQTVVPQDSTLARSLSLSARLDGRAHGLSSRPFRRGRRLANETPLPDPRLTWPLHRVCSCRSNSLQFDLRFNMAETKEQFLLWLPRRHSF